MTFTVWVQMDPSGINGLKDTKIVTLTYETLTVIGRLNEAVGI